MSPTIRRHYIIFSLFMVVVGVLASLAYRTNVSPSFASATGDRREELVQLVQSLEGRKTSLEHDLNLLRTQVSALGEQAAARQGLFEGHTAELERMSLLAGLVAVKGLGLQIEVADNPDPPDDAADPNNFIVHDYDLRALVNALWAGGAEAISVNDQRLVASSAIRCVGTTVLVNNTRLGSPFVIRAIGDQETMEAALNRDRDAHLLMTQYVKLFGLKLSVGQKDRLALPAYAGSLTPRELKPLGSG